MARGRESARFRRRAGPTPSRKSGTATWKYVAFVIGALIGRKAAAFKYWHSDTCISPAVVLPPEPTRTIPEYAHQACMEGPASRLDGCLVDFAQGEFSNLQFRFVSGAFVP